MICANVVFTGHAGGNPVSPSFFPSFFHPFLPPRPPTLKFRRLAHLKVNVSPTSTALAFGIFQV